MEARVVGVCDPAAVAAVGDDMGDGMQCSNHPYRSSPGGICAFCLQEKLGKLVSSSFPLPIRPSSSSTPPSPPSFRSDIAAATASASIASGYGVNNTSATSAAASLSLSLSVCPTSTTTTTGNDHFYYSSNARRGRIPFLLAKKKKKIIAAPSAASVSSSDGAADIVFKRSKSTATPGRGHNFLDHNEDFSPRKRGFWSFLYHSSASSSSSKKKTLGNGVSGSSSNHQMRSSLSKKSSVVIEEDDDDYNDDDDESPNTAATQTNASSFERKVSRSRSVGCGSRSFSGDFFERISTGFGDCTLRRVESQREGGSGHSNKPKVHHHQHHMKERVRCGGIFGGFIMTSSSSSSSSSSYWVPSSSSSTATDHHNHQVNGKSSSLAHGRTKSWGWAFASPMRAFSHNKPSSKDASKRDHIIRESASKNTTPNLTAIPSLLAGRS